MVRTKSTVDQQTIADQLGISRSTVTKVLRYDPVYRVSDETRELILKTAESLGYKSRRLQTKNIAFVVCGKMGLPEHEIHMVTCQEASRLQYRVFLVNLPANATYREVSLYVNPLTADGAIVMHEKDVAIASKLNELMPVVVANRMLEGSDLDNVWLDYGNLGRQMTELLLNAGHTDIGVIVSRVQDAAWRLVLDGHKQALESAGLRTNPSLTWEKEYRRYPELLPEVLSHKPRPTALLALTVADHPIILSTLIALGCRIPGDMSYCGWTYQDCNAMSVFPVIASFEDIYASIANAAINRLMERLDGVELPPACISVSAGLRRGETVVQR